MDQGIDISRAGYALRLTLLAVAAVLGLLILGAIFGSSSASAATADDDPAPSLSSTLAGVVHDVTEVAAPIATAITPVTTPVAPVAAPVTDAVETLAGSAPAASVTTPVAVAADAALVTATTKILGPGLSSAVLGSTPVGSLLTPIAAAVDEALATADDALAQAPRPAVILASGAAAIVSAATDLAGVAPAITGSTADALPLEALGGHTDPSALGVAGGGSPLPAAVLGGGLVLFLAAWRRGLLTRAMPGSPVSATDSSPD